jgi:predicted GNAT family N-acyltransferase
MTAFVDIDHNLSTFKKYQPCDFSYKIATSPIELEEYWQLRKQIFCNEQKIFNGSDKDQFDEKMIPIICTYLLAGMEDKVIGAVRIDERETGVWWGSRLCVQKDFRTLQNISPGVQTRNKQPGFYASRSVGSGLIYKAVSTAYLSDCETFYAHVQSQNVSFFRRLHWSIVEEVMLHGIRHVKMKADLRYYEPLSN